jgi:hypothetical protein
VANKGSGADGADLIEDKLWLPTEWELFGSKYYSNDTYETAANQARLAYYDSDVKRIKYDSSNTIKFYWEASPYPGSAALFARVYTNGVSTGGTASSVGGCAPAFCVT